MEAVQSPLGLGSSMGFSAYPHVASPSKTPRSSWGKGGLCHWASFPNIRMPVKDEDCQPPELGNQHHLRTPSPPALASLGPGPMQAAPALG